MSFFFLIASSEDPALGAGQIFLDDESVLKLTMVVVAQFCDHMKNHWIVQFQVEDCIVCKSYVNKEVGGEGLDR